VTNTGAGTLTLSKFQIKGTNQVVFEPTTEGQLDENQQTFTPKPKVTLGAGQNYQISLAFIPQEDDEISGQVIIFSDDPNAPDGTSIFLIGNRQRICIQANPNSIDFGLVPVEATVDVPVQIESCGPLALEITSIKLEALADMSIDFSQFPGGQAPTAAQPVSIPAGRRFPLTIRYDPTQASPIDQFEAPELQYGQISIQSNAFKGKLLIPVTAGAADTPCAVPVIEVMNSNELYVGDLVHLNGRRSISPFAQVNSWKWSVNGPAGNSPVVIIPKDTLSEVVLPVGFRGEYDVTLEVGDSDGNQTCSTAHRTLTVTPKNQALITLSWYPQSGAAPVPFQGPDVGLHALNLWGGQFKFRIDLPETTLPGMAVAIRPMLEQRGLTFEAQDSGITWLCWNVPNPDTAEVYGLAKIAQHYIVALIDPEYQIVENCLIHQSLDRKLNYFEVRQGLTHSREGQGGLNVVVLNEDCSVSVGFESSTEDLPVLGYNLLLIPVMPGPTTGSWVRPLEKDVIDIEWVKKYLNSDYHKANMIQFDDPEPETNPEPKPETNLAPEPAETNPGADIIKRAFRTPEKFQF